MILIIFQVVFLSSLGGYNMKAILRSMLNHMAVEEVWAGYSLKGRQKKKAFIDTFAYKTIISK
jgi:hypothetical protein